MAAEIREDVEMVAQCNQDMMESLSSQEIHDEGNCGIHEYYIILLQFSWIYLHIIVGNKFDSFLYYFFSNQYTNLSCLILHFGPTHARSDVSGGDVIAVEDNAESLLLKIYELAPVLFQEAHEVKELSKTM